MRRDHHLAVLAIFALIVGCGVKAFGQDHHEHRQEGHALHHDVYKEWRIPGTASSCCNEKKILPSGETTGDCYPTRARLAPSADASIKGLVWWAERDSGGWVEIPDGSIVREANPDQSGEAGHLCESQVDGHVLCFRAPNTGI